jgi:hypothetical protein
MLDSFDRPEPKQEDPKVSKEPPVAFRRQFIARIERSWCSFIHPVHGRVAGYCEKAVYAGLSQPGDVPDYTLFLVGRNPKKRNVLEVSLVDSRAQFFKTETEAVNDCT